MRKEQEAAQNEMQTAAQLRVELDKQQQYQRELEQRQEALVEEARKAEHIRAEKEGVMISIYLTLKLTTHFTTFLEFSSSQSCPFKGFWSLCCLLILFALT